MSVTDMRYPSHPYRYRQTDDGAQGHSAKVSATSGGRFVAPGALQALPHVGFDTLRGLPRLAPVGKGKGRRATVHRWMALSGVCLMIGVMLTGETVAADQGTPCPDAPTIEERYTYDPDEPFLLIGTGNASTTFVVHCGGHDRFEALLVDPDGESNSIFAAIRPSGVSSSHSLEQVGEYVIEVEANGPWSLYVQ